MSSNYFKTLSGDVAKRYLEKVEICEGVDPYTIDMVATRKEDFPAVEYQDLYNYLVFSTSTYSADQMRAYKSLDAYIFFQNGWVKCIFCTRIPNSKTIVCGQVGKLKYFFIQLHMFRYL